MRLRAYECGLKGSEISRIVHAESAGKARYRYLLDIGDCCPDVEFKDIRCRMAGPPMTSDDFRSVADKRGVPFARIGMAVEVDGRRGVIVGHNDSSNFDVLFEANDNVPINCHPNWKMKYFDGSGELIKEFQG